MDKLLNECRKLKNKMVRIRRYLHMYPEVGFNEINTSRYIAAELKKLKIPYKFVLETGIVGLIKGNKADKTIALRADIDGLPIPEENDKPYKSKNKGVMHACGHDCHAACLLGAAMLLTKIKGELNGNVKLIFQPCEENSTKGGGARCMVKEGVLNDPKVDAVIALHVSDEYDVGTIALRYGMAFANTDKIIIRIKGEGSHGSAPHKSIDPVIASASVIQNLQTIISRNKDPYDLAVLSITAVNSGAAFNVIPSYAEILGTVRTFDNKVREKIKALIRRIVAGTASALGTKFEFEFKGGYPAFANNDKMADLIKISAIEIVGKNNVKLQKKPSFGGEDFSFFIKDISGVMFRLGIRNKKKGISYGLHHPKFDIDEDCLPIGSAVLAKACLNYFANGF